MDYVGKTYIGQPSSTNLTYHSLPANKTIEFKMKRLVFKVANVTNYVTS